MPSAKLPSLASTGSLPWMQSLSVGSGSSANTLGSLVSYPNLALAQDTSASPASAIMPNYNSTPAPMGLADYGLGAAHPYAYNTTHFLATVDLASMPNVTAPNTEALIDPAGSHVGLVGSPYEFSLQLNTVLTNVTIPGTDSGVFWTQNVLDINATAIHFVDDVWNLSTDSHLIIPNGSDGAPPTIASGCGLTNLTSMLAFGQGVYQCVGGSIPLTSADFPLSIQLYNNASVTSKNQDQVQFGYRIVGDTTVLGTAISDTVVFNNPNGSHAAPTLKVAFEVNGFSRAPAQTGGLPRLLQDAEITFGGPIGGSNAVFRSLAGSLSLQFSNSSGPWKNVPSAYNFGDDTGETAIGIAGTWSGATETIHQGPSFLYGLWNGTTGISVNSGSIQFQGSVSPIYGFVFVSNVAPGPNGTNLSWVPTTAAGTFSTYLPPAIPATGGSYYTEMYAAGNLPDPGTSFSTSQASYSFPAATSSGVITAPLYMQGNTQAQDLAAKVAGWATGPLVFNGLVVNLPMPFTHLNGYLFPSFVIFQAEGVSVVLEVNNTSEGANVLGGENYTSPLNGTFGPLQNFTEGINIFGSTGAKVTNETLRGPSAYTLPIPLNRTGRGVGGTVFLFGDTDASVANVTSEDRSYGVANELSAGTGARALQALGGGWAFTSIASSGTVVRDVVVSGDGSVGVYFLSSRSPTVSWVNASDGAVGYVSGSAALVPAYYALAGSHDASVRELNATAGSIAAIDSYSSGDSFKDVSTYGASGIIVGRSTGSTIEDISALPDSGGVGVLLVGANYTNVTTATYDLYDCTNCAGVNASVSNHTTLSTTTINQNYTFYYGDYDEFGVASDGIEGLSVNFTTITDTTINQSLAYCYGYWDAFDEYSRLNGIAIDGANYTTVRSTNLTQTFALCGIHDGYADEYNSLDGVVLFDSNDGTISATKANQTFSATDLHHIARDSASFVAVAAVFSNDTTITGTTVSENYSLDRLYDAWDNGGAFIAAAAFASNHTTIESTAVTQNVSMYYLYRSVDNYVTELGAYVSFANFTSVTKTNDTQNFSINNLSYAYDNGGNLSAVAVNDTNVTTVSTTAVTQQYSIYGLDDEAEDNYVAFSGVGANGTDGLTVSGTTVHQNFTEVDSDELGYNSGTFVAVEATNGIALQVSGTTVSQSYYAHYLDDAFHNGGDFYLAGVENETGVTFTGSTVTQVYWHGNVSEYSCNHGDFYGIGGLGLANVSITDTQVTSTSDYWATDFTAISLAFVWNLTVTTVTATATPGTQDWTDGLYGLAAEYTFNATVSHVTASNGFEAVLFDPSANLTISDVTASNGGSGVWLSEVTNATVTDVSATNQSVGVGVLDRSSEVDVSSVTVSDLSVGAFVFESREVTISGVTATDTSVSPTWTLAFPHLFGIPLGAVTTIETDQVSVSHVTATDYPAAIIDYDSGEGDYGPGGLTVQSVTATGGAYLAMLNYTESSVFTDLSGTGLAYGVALNETENDYFGTVSVTHDTVGVSDLAGERDSFTALNASNDGQGMVLGTGEEEENPCGEQVWSSTFSNDTGYGISVTDGFGNDFWLNRIANDGNYGIYFWAGEENYVWDNSFIGDNGATTTYSAAHIQAYTSTDDNFFNSESDVGNYWADWHQFTSAGVLAPYYVGSGDWDYYPLGVEAQQYEVIFSESGLGSGAAWSVTFNGLTQTTTNAELIFGATANTYAFKVGVPAGYTATPASGTVSVPLTASGVVSIAFQAVGTVTLTEAGLAAGTSWTATVGGVTNTSTTPSMTFSLPLGTYPYSVVPVAGYTLPATGGTVTVTSSGVSWVVTFTRVVYTVTFTETGLPAGTAWSLTVGGTPYTSSGTSIALALANGSYSYAYGAVSGFSVTGGSGTLSVNGFPTGTTATYVAGAATVTIKETGLPSGTTWNATVGGHLGTSTTGSILIPVLPGTYTYAIAPVAGYTVSAPTGPVNLTPAGYTVIVAFTEVKYTASFTETGLTTGTAWSVAVNGVLYTTSGTTITVALPNGSFLYSFENVSGYSVSGASGHLTVTGSSSGAMAAYSPSTSPAYVTNPTFNTDWAVALGVAAVAIIVALFALLRKPRTPNPPPATAWQEPAGSQGGTSGGPGH